MFAESSADIFHFVLQGTRHKNTQIVRKYTFTYKNDTLQRLSGLKVYDIIKKK